MDAGSSRSGHSFLSRSRSWHLLWSCATFILGPDLVVAQTAQVPVPPPSSITQIVPPSAVIAPFTLELGLPGATPDRNVRVNSNAASLGRAQVEPSVASNPADPLQLVAGFADAIDDFAPGVARSIDGGQTWSAPAGGAILPDPPGFAWGNRSVAAQLAAGDSAVAWGLSNVVYFATLGFHDNRAPRHARLTPP